MINFMICDDDIKYRDLIAKTITSFMMDNDIEYKMHLFDDYNSEFIQKIEDKMSAKVYILDIETPTRSGIDIARIIRQRDLNSVLIFITGHQEL